MKIEYWRASWEEDAGGAFGATRYGDLGAFDSEEKAKEACQMETSLVHRERGRGAPLLIWRRPAWRIAPGVEADLRDVDPCFDGRSYAVVYNVLEIK